MAGLNGHSKWRDATPSTPCPVCKGQKWCSVSADGELCHCRKEPSGPFGAGTEEKDKNDCVYWRHRLTDNPRASKWDPPRYNLEDGKGELASVMMNRARPVARSQRIGFRLYAIALLPTCSA